MRFDPQRKRLEVDGWSARVTVLDIDATGDTARIRTALHIRDGFNLVVEVVDGSPEVYVEAWAGGPGGSDGLAVITDQFGEPIGIARILLDEYGERHASNSNVQMASSFPARVVPRLIELLGQLPDVFVKPERWHTWLGELRDLPEETGGVFSRHNTSAPDYGPAATKRPGIGDRCRRRTSRRILVVDPELRIMRLPGVVCRFVGLGLAVAVVGAGCSSSHRAPTIGQHVVTPGGPPGEVYFRPVLCVIPPESREAAPGSPESACQSSTPALVASSGEQANEQETAASSVLLHYIGGGKRYVCGPADLTSADIVSARAEPSPGMGFGYEVVLKLTPGGERKLDAVAAARYVYYKQNPSNPPPQSLEAIEQGYTVLVAAPMESPKFNGTVMVTSPAMNLNMADQLVQIIDQIIAYDRTHGTRA
ncbi:MAG TPA: hypothetical protein VFV02_15920 [Acidimicrobiales bacterium]|nr:hypothetical protein [Acidimicrobiales bacterium]